MEDYDQDLERLLGWGVVLGDDFQGGGQVG
jgi:hypothetical protein